MSSVLDPALVHPMVATVRALHAALDVESSNPTFLTPEDKREVLLELSRLETRLVALRLRVMAVSGEVAEADGARDVAAWLSHHTRHDTARGRRDLRLATSLDHSFGVVAAALARGAVNEAQATVIVHALEALPADVVSPEVRHRAERHLVDEAAHFGPRELRVLGRRVLEVVAPQVAEAEEERALEREEQRAREDTSLTMTRLGDGTTRVLARLPDLVAARLRTYLDAFTSPRHDRPGAEKVPAHRRAGLAFCSLLERLDPDRLPTHGGTATTLVVTMDLDQLRSATGVAESATGERLSAGEVRRLACTARILPAVLGGASQLLDLGRSRRLFSPAQHTAMAIRDRGCRAEGCTIPAAWCEAHHRHPWSTGGRTDLADGALLCSWHHHRVHDARYAATWLSSGVVRLVRRT